MQIADWWVNSAICNLQSAIGGDLLKDFQDSSLKSIQPRLPAARRGHELGHMRLMGPERANQFFEHCLGTDLTEKVGQSLLADRADILNALTPGLAVEHAQIAFFEAASRRLFGAGARSE